MKRGFTLVELLIVLVIVGGLTTILFRSYINISELSVRIENEKIVASETMLLQQFMQNLIDTNRIEFDAYTGENKKEIYQNGFTDTLALGGGQEVLIYQTGDCIAFTGDIDTFIKSIQQKKCRIEAQIEGNTTRLTEPNTVYISNTIFKLLPSQYYTGEVIQYFEGKRNMRQNQGVRMLGHMRIRNFGNERTRNVQVPIQSFYHIQQ